MATRVQFNEIYGVVTIDYASQEVPIRPLRGSVPQKFKRLQNIPKRITENHLHNARAVLQMGSSSFLVDLKQDDDPRWKELWRDYVELAVYQQWQHFDPEKLLEVLQQKGKLVDKSPRGNRLYRWAYSTYDVHSYARATKRELVFYYLAYTCPSTGKLYLSGVPSQNWGERPADQAMAWKYGLTLKEYDQLKTEA